MIGSPPIKLKIFSDRNYIPEGMPSETMLAPFWQEVSVDPELLWNSRFNRYIETGKSFFEMTSLEEADLAIMPIPWHAIRGRRLLGKENQIAKQKAIQFAQKVQQAGKPIVIFFVGPRSDEKIPINNGYIFRGSLYRSSQKNNEFALPLWTEDIISLYLNNQIPIRQKKSKPIIGFCGYVQKENLQSKLKDILYKMLPFVNSGSTKQSPYQGHSIRYRALNILSKSSLIDTNFIERSGYIFLSESDRKLKQKIRLEYIENIIDSDYILCCRGSANCSFRLYETLCCGRIPVFINTDCVLPYDFIIDYKKYCVWIEERELPLIAEKVADFHSSLSSQEFITLQYECRNLWKKWLSPEGFFSNFYRHFKTN